MVLAFKKIPSGTEGETHAQVAKTSRRKFWKCANNEVLGGLDDGLRFPPFGGTIENCNKMIILCIWLLTEDLKTPEYYY